MEVLIIKLRTRLAGVIRALFLLSSILIFEVSKRLLSAIKFWSCSLIRTGPLNLELVILVDKYSLIFARTVLFISRIVFMFSSFYISEEPFFLRFHLLVAAFVASILLLIFSLNIISLILGWDGLGLSSYLLVIYYQRPKSLNAGILTALSNRVGDVFIMTSCAIRRYIESANFLVSRFSTVSSWKRVILVLFLARITKRAQIPYSAWLPAAMAAPTPVSALVHSSTLVTAGVYLIFRYSYSFSAFSEWMIAWVGSLTILIAGISALKELDSKKIVALSTLRQLGLIFSRIGVGANRIAFFHLLIHAFIKALLFITIGSVIHNSCSTQDIRYSNQRGKRLTISKTFMIIRNAGLRGFPFLAGFYSKDLWLEHTVNSHQNILLIFVFYFRVRLTLLYRFRLIALIRIKNSQINILAIIDDKALIRLRAITGLWVIILLSGGRMSSLLFTTSVLKELRPGVKNITLDLILLSVIIAVILIRFSPRLGSSWLIFNLWGLPNFSSSLWRKLGGKSPKIIIVSIEGGSKIFESVSTSLVSQINQVLNYSLFNLWVLIKITMLLLVIFLVWQ